jgi:sulfite exporter TauE/SafE
MSFSELGTIFSIAFIGSFGHCIGMCGGIAVAYSATKIKPSMTKTYQIFAHLLYSFGRVTTYTIFGIIFGTLGGVATFSNNANGLLLLFASVIMFLTSLSLLGKLKFLTTIEHSLSSAKWYQEYFSSLLHSSSFFSFYLLGLLNGLLPCGFVYFFAITAASSASTLWGGVVMFVFGIATIPSLFLVSFFVGSFKNFQFRNIMLKISSFAIMGFSLYTFYRGYYFLFDPSATILHCH